MEKIIENGQKMDGIPYAVEFWNADNNMWDDSVEELGAIYAHSADEAIDYAIEYMLDGVRMYGPEDATEAQEECEKWNDADLYRVNEVKNLHLFVWETYRDNWGMGNIALYTDRVEAIRAAEAAWSGMCAADRDSYRRDAAGVFRVYEISIPFGDIVDGPDGEPYAAEPYTEYEDLEWYNALEED